MKAVAPGFGVGLFVAGKTLTSTFCSQLVGEDERLVFGDCVDAVAVDGDGDVPDLNMVAGKRFGNR